LFFLQWVAGREREARDEVLRLLQLDPLSAYANVILSFSDVSSGRMSEAVDHARRGVELDPNSYLAYWSLMQALLSSAQYEEATEAAERGLAISGRHSWALATLVSIYAHGISPIKHSPPTANWRRAARVSTFNPPCSPPRRSHGKYGSSDRDGPASGY